MSCDPTPIPPLLTTETVCAWVVEHAALIGAPVDEQLLSAVEIEGGNLNYAWRVSGRSDGFEVFVKQTPDFIKCLGPEAALHRERMVLELAFYDEWRSVLSSGGDSEQAEQQPSTFVPRVLCFDEDRMVFAMEWLGDTAGGGGFELLVDRLAGMGGEDVAADGATEGSIFCGAKAAVAAAAADEVMWNCLGRLLALAHARTHVTVIAATEVDRLSARFENATLRAIQLEHVFSKAFRESARWQQLVRDNDAKNPGVAARVAARLEAVRQLYKGQGAGKGSNLALCHGDLHAGSLMVDASPSTAATGAAAATLTLSPHPHQLAVKVIDPEFAVYAPPGLDVGSLLAGVALAAMQHWFGGGAAAGAARAAALARLAAAVPQFLTAYETELVAHGVPEAAAQQATHDAIQFAACEIARTALGFAGSRGITAGEGSCELPAAETGAPVAVRTAQWLLEQSCIGLAFLMLCIPEDAGGAILMSSLESLAEQAAAGKDWQSSDQDA